MQIFEARLKDEPIQEVDLPYGAVILTAQQHGRGLAAVSLWYQCDERQPTKQRRLIAMYQCGDFIPAKAVYISTVRTPNGHFVLHIYEVTD